MEVPLGTIYPLLNPKMVRRPFFIFHKFSESGFIVYSQAYTNTYRPLSVLKAKYDMVRKYPEVVGISIATHRITWTIGVLDLVSSYTNSYEVWMEYGLQSIHKNT